ncbi:MAE_28990/MAE_18760 family HEPN-like nuclease [Flavobacterium sp.]|jgi:hypothetical protein|uniref:MAE_28990/MAE_18760 family HEPN-like nuclease n=1 Tax=Flavobacterium sp. TaxID=239 RepID=UPI0037BE4653
MRLNTKEDFFDAINEDIAWRKKELTYIKSNIKDGTPNYKTNLRIGVLLLYAHYEGFIKSACENYLKHIKLKRLNYVELTENILATSLKYELKNFEESNKATIHCQIVDFIQNKLNQRANIPTDNVIKTGSNLSSHILREILTTVGIDYTNYELKSNLIDQILLKNRNSIAHGEYVPLDEVEYSELNREILFIMDDIKDRLTNIVVLEQYKKTIA